MEASSTAHTAYGGSTDSGQTSQRAAALARTEQLRADAQDGLAVGPAIAELITDAERRGWSEVVRAGLYADIDRAKSDGDEAHVAAIERLLERSLSDGDVAMAAIAYAQRARALTRSDNPSSSVAADRDLARASVLIEGALEASPDLARAHINCAIAHGQRDLWELEEEHYQAAKEVLIRLGIEDRLRRVILYNRAEVQLNWACALRELGETTALEFRARAAARDLAAADVPEMPAGWRDELVIFTALLAAMRPGVVPAPESVQADGEYAGYVHLARALSLADHRQAAEAAQAAIATIDPDDSPNTCNLALCVAAEIESSVAGADTAGLRYARHLARLRWAKRLSALAAMQSLLQAERLSTEHALLSQHAYLDDLTRLANRRAMARYVDSLAAQGVSSVAMILIDVDRFKEINDTFGHAIGDQALVRLAGLLRAAVRSGDLAVRLGGDEFLLLLAAAEPDAARRRAATILAAMGSEPWEEIVAGLEVRASVGVVWGDPRQLDRLGLAADSALYRSKAAGGGRISEG